MLKPITDTKVHHCSEIQHKNNNTYKPQGTMFLRVNSYQLNIHYIKNIIIYGYNLYYTTQLWRLAITVETNNERFDRYYSMIIINSTQQSELGWEKHWRKNLKNHRASEVGDRTCKVLSVLSSIFDNRHHPVIGKPETVSIAGRWIRNKM